MPSAPLEKAMHGETEVAEKIHPPGLTGELKRGQQLFQRFALQKFLGAGELGPVWLAKDERLDRQVALKILPEGIRFDLAAADRLRNAAQSARLLNHPNIGCLFAFLERDEASALVLEYVDGPTLATLCAQKRANCFAVSEIAPWVTSLCDALAYAHDSVGIVHGNLSPSNLMVDGGTKLKVMDFGLGLERSNTAPEVTDDIYGFGATLYELLSGKPFSFEGESATSVSQARKKAGIAGEAVPKHWEGTIAACLSPEPERRPPSALEIARRLRLGGTIRLAAEEEESKMRILVRNLTHARLVGAAAGVAALIAAAILALRAAHPNAEEMKKAPPPDTPSVQASVAPSASPGE